MLHWFNDKIIDALTTIQLSRPGLCHRRRQSILAVLVGLVISFNKLSPGVTGATAARRPALIARGRQGLSCKHYSVHKTQST